MKHLYTIQAGLIDINGDYYVIDDSIESYGSECDGMRGYEEISLGDLARQVREERPSSIASDMFKQILREDIGENGIVENVDLIQEDRIELRMEE